jgi:hypothetical protein
MEESLNRFESTSNERGMTVKMSHVLGFSFQNSDGPMPCEAGKNRLLCRVLSLFYLRPLRYSGCSGACRLCSNFQKSNQESAIGGS